MQEGRWMPDGDCRGGRRGEDGCPIENGGIGKLRNDGAADGVLNYVLNVSPSGCFDVDMC